MPTKSPKMSKPSHSTAKQVSKVAVKSAAKPVPKSAAKPAVKSAPKSAAKVVAKAPVKAPAKVLAKPAAKPVVKSAAKPEEKKVIKGSKSAAPAKLLKGKSAPVKDQAKPVKEVEEPPKSLRQPKAAPEVMLGAKDITNYNSALKWLHQHQNHETLRVVKYDPKAFSLDRMRELLKVMGNPQDNLKCVHVAGTKGKGSTCAMLAAMLEGCGYSVGLYTSPHLMDLRERISINTAMVPCNDLFEIFREIAKLESKIKPGLTFFEIMTAAALQYFADQAVDVVVLETGLGGRLDATNVVTPLVSLITQISYDHMNVLGKTLPEIAREKGGICKKGVPAITVDQQPAEVEAVLRESAESAGSRLEVCGKEIDFSYRFEANKELGPHMRVSLLTDKNKFEHLPVPLKGEHQALNCGLALAALDKLAAHGFVFEEGKVVAGLATTKLMGRMEEVWNHPKVIIDGAHNAASLAALIKSIGAHVPYDSMVMIFACGADKDIKGMLEQVAVGADKVIFTQAKNNPRSVSEMDLLRDFGEITGKMAQHTPDLQAALKLAARAVSRDDLILITGSFYLAGEARKHFHQLSELRAQNGKDSKDARAVVSAAAAAAAAKRK